VALVVCAARGVSAQAPVRSAAPTTFHRDVAPILFDKCATCHRPGGAAPFGLLTYADARQRARLIATAVSTHVMPPWPPDGERDEFEGDRRLLPEEIQTLTRWVDDGLLEGDSGDARPTPPFSAGWQLGTPDLVVSLPEPFEVPADGPDVFRNFVLRIPLEDRRFVRALEFRAGNARLVHHARMLLDDSGDVRRLDEREPGPGFGGMDVPGARFPEGHFLGWAPGKRVTPERFPWSLEPGTDLVVQLHLKPTGRAEGVQPSIGLYFTDAPPERIPIVLRLGSKTIDIPAGDAAYEVVDRLTLPVDVRAFSISPHAHYLASSMQVEATLPTGGVRTLLRIPEWNFNWQDEYAWTEPVLLRRGTTIEMRYRYDNSARNPHNPSAPPRRVRFGSETSDEMGELLLQVVPVRDTDAGTLRAMVTRKNIDADIAGEEKRLADQPADAATRIALGVAYVQVGRAAEAVVQFERAVQADPSLPMGHYNLGVVAMGQQRVDEAIARFERAIALRPDYAEAHNNLGIALELVGRSADAEAHYRAALASRSAHVGAHNNLGRVRLAQGDRAGALAEFQAALRTRPDHPDALYNLGRAFIAGGQAREAVRAWRRALQLRPESVVFALDLAWVLATNAEVLDAREATRIAERTSGAERQSNPAALDVLAAAYAAAGRIELAARTAQLALQRALAVKNDRLAAEIRQRLDVYRSATRGDADVQGGGWER